MYGYLALIGMGVGSSITAGFAVVQAMVEPNQVNNAVGFMSIGKFYPKGLVSLVEQIPSPCGIQN